MSAQRCFTAWKPPIGRPNCSRSLAYSTAVLRDHVAPPSISADTPTAERSMSAVTASAPPSFTAGVSPKVNQPSERVVSIAGSADGRPVASRSTAKRAGLPPSSAKTTATCASGAAMTRSLRPESAHSESVACVLSARAVTPPLDEGALQATQPMASPLRSGSIHR